MHGAGRITGWGGALPPKVLTNADLQSTLDTSDAWIVERTGIRERRVGGTTAGLAIEAGRAALDRAGADPASVELVIVCTCTPDDQFPAAAAVVQHELGTAGGAMDLAAACAGFVYGLVAAEGQIRLGTRRILLVGSETLSRIVDWEDRSTAVLFGDGAGAVLLDAVTDGGPGGMLGWDLGNDGSLRSILWSEPGGPIRMDGPEVFRRAVRVVVDSSLRALTRAGLRPCDVDLLVPHQANQRIIDAVCARLGIPAERTAGNLDRTGNTSAASIPLALAEAADAGRVRPGDRVLMVGFGAGMSWASAVIEWGR